MRMVDVDLIRGALLELGYNIVQITVIRLRFFRRRVKDAFDP